MPQGKLKAGYGIKIMNLDNGPRWITEQSISPRRDRAMSFDSKDGADSYRSLLSMNNPQHAFETVKFTE